MTKSHTLSYPFDFDFARLVTTRLPQYPLHRYRLRWLHHADSCAVSIPTLSEMSVSPSVGTLLLVLADPGR